MAHAITVAIPTELADQPDQLVASRVGDMADPFVLCEDQVIRENPASRGTETSAEV